MPFVRDTQVLGGGQPSSVLVVALDSLGAIADVRALSDASSDQSVVHRLRRTAKLPGDVALRPTGVELSTEPRQVSQLPDAVRRRVPAPRDPLKAQCSLDHPPRATQFLGDVADRPSAIEVLPPQPLGIDRGGSLLDPVLAEVLPDMGLAAADLSG